MQTEARELPATGQTIIFDKVPAGSYCTAGVAYQVTAPRRPGGDFHFVRADGSSGTYDRAWAVRAAKWRVLEAA